MSEVTQLRLGLGDGAEMRQGRLHDCHRKVWWRDIQIPAIELCELPPDSEETKQDGWLLDGVVEQPEAGTAMRGDL